MKKILISLIIIIFFIFSVILTTLSTIGIETKKFNKLVSNRINQINTNINLKLDIIKFKIDIKNLSLFLETINPTFSFKNIDVPVSNIKVYVDFKSLIKQEPQIKKINLILNQINIDQAKELSFFFKPSNFNSFLNNKIKDGKLDTEIEVFLNNKNQLRDFIAKGTVNDLEIDIIDNLKIQKTKFSFLADKKDVLIKNIFSETDIFKIIDGDLKIKLEPEIQLESNFQTNLLFKDKFKTQIDFLKNFEFIKNISFFEAELNNSFTLKFDKTFKVKKYTFKSSGELSSVIFDINPKSKNNLFTKKINRVNIINSKIKMDINSKKNEVAISGKYAIEKDNFLNFNLKTIFNNRTSKAQIKLDYDEEINFEIINYFKKKGSKAIIEANLEKDKKGNIKIHELNFSEKDNLISLQNLNLKEDKFFSLDKLSIKTKKEDKFNNDFSLLFNKKIMIEGKSFDATNLIKTFNKQTDQNLFLYVNKDIEIDFSNIHVSSLQKLENFKLIGRIEKGKFVKISSKGSFGGGNFLDISMEDNKENKKKYLEIYSDLTKPLLTELSFFKGLSGGNLLYTSVIEENISNSKLLIENFKVVNAPGMVKLLSLADLGGLADLAVGDGISFDILEIKMEKSKNNLKLNEILALGPSLSVLMEGYQDDKITSLRGTLIPAKALNKLISKIPLIGDIIIPKEIGEGLFGISFKMKGPPGKIKTTINPVRTITPRFIQKIIERKKLNNFN